MHKQIESVLKFGLCTRQSWTDITKAILIYACSDAPCHEHYNFHRKRHREFFLERLQDLERTF
jgi:hypothetical protein